MEDNARVDDSQGDEHDPLITAYRHDAHKLNGEPHRTAPETFADLLVNEVVPLGADADASDLSRPRGEPQKTVANHETHYRLSLLTGESQYDPETFSRPGLSEAIIDLLSGTNPDAMHRAWLTSDVASGFNESNYYPYTSLKYHTLLVAALLDNYRDGTEFNDLCLVVDDGEEIVPHRTVYVSDRFALRIDESANGNPWARLGDRPGRSWSSTWARLTVHPLNTAHHEYDRILDANLRRIWSWSTALQYLEDFEQWGTPP